MTAEKNAMARTTREVAACRESDMSDKIYDVPAEWKQRGFVDEAKYKQMYERSVKDPNGFWGEQAKRIDWMKPFTKVKNTSFAPSNVSIKWFEDGTLNAAYNCIDRHLPSAPSRPRSSGRATTPRTTSTSPTKSFTTRCAGWRTSCATATSRRATASPSICQ